METPTYVVSYLKSRLDSVILSIFVKKNHRRIPAENNDLKRLVRIYQISKLIVFYNFKLDSLFFILHTTSFLIKFTRSIMRNLLYLTMVTLVLAGCGQEPSGKTKSVGLAVKVGNKASKTKVVQATLESIAKLGKVSNDEGITSMRYAIRAEGEVSDEAILAYRQSYNDVYQEWFDEMTELGRKYENLINRNAGFDVSNSHRYKMNEADIFERAEDATRRMVNSFEGRLNQIKRIMDTEDKDIGTQALFSDLRGIPSTEGVPIEKFPGFAAIYDTSNEKSLGYIRDYEYGSPETHPVEKILVSVRKGDDEKMYAQFHITDYESGFGTYREEHIHLRLILEKLTDSKDFLELRRRLAKILEKEYSFLFELN